MKSHYYLETDGQIFLIKKGALWGFPQSRKDLPCPFKTLFTIPVGKEKVIFAKPTLGKHPVHWFHKDEVVGRVDIDPVVHLAVNRTLARGSAKVIIVEKGKVLMVKASRGFTKGYWNLPGGFMGYGEHPAESAQREAEEEMGVRVKLLRLIGIYSKTFPNSGGHMLSFVYEGKRLNKTFKLQEDEIEEIRWIPLRTAIRNCKNMFACAGLRDYAKGRTAVHPCRT